MKRILTSLLVLAMCAPAMAATVAFVNNGNGTGTFTITATEFMVGLGLDVDATGGNVTAVAVPAAFNIYPDAAYTLELGAGYTYGAGTPVCAKLVPGQIALPQSSFALCFANLNGATTPGANGAQVVAITFTVSASGTQVCIAENDTRGGVIGTLGEDVALTGTLCGTITSGPSTYNLTTATTAGGTVTDPGIGVFAKAANQPANLVAAAHAGWFFLNWTGSAVAAPASASTTILMDADKSVTANFTLACAKYNVTKEVGGTDNVVNVNDVNALINWVNANKGALWAVPSTNPAYNVPVAGTTYGLVYNITKKEGGTDSTVNVNDLNAMVNYVNKRKGALWSVNCSTCGC
jgi:hypothetical protein